MELRANVSSVESDLGGGDHGYLGLVLTNAEHANVSAIPFVPPNFPPPLVIPPGSDQVTALDLREQHKENRRLYCECKNVEKALLRHMQDAIEDKYLESLVDEDTQLIQEDIPTVLENLFANYGKVPSEEVKQQESEIRTMTFHPADPMTLSHDPTEKLKKLAQAVDIACTDAQILDIRLTVIRNTRDFENTLGEWERKPTANKTWDNFKTHFKTAQQELKAIRGPTMQQAGYHHANHLANQLRDDVAQRDTDTMTILQTVIDSQSVIPPSIQ